MKPLSEVCSCMSFAPGHADERSCTGFDAECLQPLKQIKLDIKNRKSVDNSRRSSMLIHISLQTSKGATI